MPRRDQRSCDSSRLFSHKVCAFCGRNDDNEILYGKFVISDDISLHNNCMFFASGLSQHGEDESVGYSGFLLSDINAELRRGKKLACSYCKKRGATIGCCNVKCKKSFHLPCGIKYHSLNQFFGSFLSFCKDHAPKQHVDEIRDSYCYICCEDISPKNLKSCLYSPCCKNSWFHKMCLQKYALSAGVYFFKCPLCNNSGEFVKEMQTYGIRIPDKDASWELEDNAYQELLIRPKCSASICLSSKGRKYNTSKPRGWTLLPCLYCGAVATHKNCANIKLSATSWICQECKSFEERRTSFGGMPETGDANALNSTEDAIALKESDAMNLPASPSNEQSDVDAEMKEVEKAALHEITQLKSEFQKVDQQIQNLGQLKMKTPEPEYSQMELEEICLSHQ